jgi:hypothetical protein
MHVFFADDAKQNQPSRVRMGALVASGGLFVDGDRLANFERALNNACNSAGFPPNAEFKWSPRRDMWMHQNLVAAERQAFFISVIECCVDHQARALVIISDCESRTPSDCASHEVFVTKMLVERVNNLAVSTNSAAIIIADRPGGGIAQERKFLADTLSTIQTGTRYVKPAQIAINALSTDSHLVRALQAADLIVSCTTALVAGQTTLAPIIFEAIKPILAREWGRAGGVGVKIHPDFKYLNLYHWLVGDETWMRNMMGIPLPYAGRPYATGPNTF